MASRLRRRLVAVLVTGLLLAVEAPAAAQSCPANQTLEIKFPKAAGSGQTGLPSYFRHFHAYPNLLYEIDLAFKGGTLPVTWSITGGTATWLDALTQTNGGSRAVLSGTPTNTTTDDGTRTVQVVDACGSSASVTWSINVNTEAFVFVDSVNGNDSTGAGTLASPWQTWDKVRTPGTATAKLVYFRAGTYDCITCSGSGGTNGGAIVFNAVSNAAAFLAYPGETVIFEFGADGTVEDDTPHIRFVTPGYVDGIQHQNGYLHFYRLTGFQLPAGIFRNNTFTTLGGCCEGTGGSNAAAIMIDDSGCGADAVCAESFNSDGSVFVANTFSGLGEGWSAIKLYGMLEVVVTANDMTCSYTTADACLALKGGISLRWDVRHNVVRGLRGCGGNMWTWSEGEIRFNVFLSSGQSSVACRINESTDVNNPTNVYTYRNTFWGRLEVGMCNPDGPFYFTRNVIINDQGSASPVNGLTPRNCTDASTVVMTDNLLGSDSNGYINTTTGALIGSALTNHGPESALPKGHMLDEDEGGDPPPPDPPADGGGRPIFGGGLLRRVSLPARSPLRAALAVAAQQPLWVH